MDLAAPGNYILSTITGNGYAYMSGTSMAAPMVTGTAAMLYSCDASLSLMDVRNRILQSARPLESLSGKVATGVCWMPTRVRRWEKRKERLLKKY